MHGGQFVAQKSRMTTFPRKFFSLCVVAPSKLVQLISVKGFDGGSGKFVCGTSFIEIGLFETETGAAAGRHAAERKKVKVKSKKKKTFIEFILHEDGRENFLANEQIDYNRLSETEKSLYFCRFPFN